MSVRRRLGARRTSLIIFSSRPTIPFVHPIPGSRTILARRTTVNLSPLRNNWAAALGEKGKIGRRDLSSISDTSVASEPSEIRRRLRLPARRPKGISKRFWFLIQGLQVTYIGRPRVVERSSEDMPKAAFYAVAAGRKSGVYTTWSDAEAQVKGYAGARYKKFPSEAQALEFMASESSPSSVGGARAKYTTSKSSRPTTSTSTSSRAGPSTSSLATSSSSRTVTEARTRAESPPTNAPQSTLPPRLQDLAKEGYKFTKGPVHYLVVHTDGSALGNGKVGSRAGAGVFWGSSGDAASRNLSERVPGVPQTNNRGELLAVIRALEICPFPDIPLEVRCDSQYTISCMTTWLPKWLRTNFRTSSTPYTRPNGSVSSTSSASLSTNQSKQVSNVDMVKHLLVLLRRRGKEGRVKFKYVPAHTGIEGNEAADKLAKMGSMSPEVPNRTDWLDPDKEPISSRSFNKGADEVKGEPTKPEPDSEQGITDIEVEIDENWLMSPEELANFEDELVEA